MIGADSQPSGSWYRWHELKRHEIVELARDGVVVIPLGAIEQHGPFMPTGADILLSTHATELALTRVAAQTGRPLIMAQILNFGCSAHHLPFGGTISLPPSLMIEVLVAAMRSMIHSGVTRIILINGHGGNTGVCNAAASEAASHTGLTVAALDYWESAPPVDPPAPGHAGFFETSLLLAARPELVARDRHRDDRDDVPQPGRGIYARAVWTGIDGFTDHPAEATAELGAEYFEAIETNLAQRLSDLIAQMP